MKLKQFLEANRETVVESTNYFDDVDVIKVDPDKHGPRDVVKALLPTLVKMGYVKLLLQKSQHEKDHGPKSDEEDAYNFPFNQEELINGTEEIIESLTDKLRELDTFEFEEAIKEVSKDFKEKLDEA